MLQKLNYTENPVDIPNPDRGWYRGRVEGPGAYAATTDGSLKSPEVDHRVPIDASTPLQHGFYDPTIEGDDIEFSHPSNTTKGGTMPSVSFMTFNLNLYSSNAILGYDERARIDAAINTPPTLKGKNGRDFVDLSKVTKEMFFDGERALTGKTGPITQFGLDYMRGLLQKVREGNATAFVKFSYDGDGFNSRLTNLPCDGTWPPEPSWESPINPSGMCDVSGHTDKNWVEYHIWQLKPIFYEFEDIITCVKTGMFGAWGEQHTSPVSRDPVQWKKLHDAYLDAVPPSRVILTHGGGFLAWYNLTYGTNYTAFDVDKLCNPPKGSPEARFGFFNDSYQAGYGGGEWCDNGSLAEGLRMLVPEWKDSIKPYYTDFTRDADWGIDAETYGYDRYRLVKWIGAQNTMHQGEGGMRNNVFANMPGAIMEGMDLKLNLLNMRWGGRIGGGPLPEQNLAYKRWENFIYNEENVTHPVTFPKDNSEFVPMDKADNWGTGYTGKVRTLHFDPVYDGKTGIEYMRDRMGYRLVLREADMDETVEAKGGTLTFKGKIQNVGFGNVVNRKKVSVLLQAKGASNYFTVVTDLDAGDWQVAEDGNSRADNKTAWRDLNFEVKMEEFGNIPSGDYNVFLKINDPKETSENRRCIQFANYDIWNASLGANQIGSISVR